MTDSTQGINTGPGGTGGTANVTGSWLYSTSNLKSGPISCASSGTMLVLSQQGSTVTGTYSGGTITCGAGGPTQTLAIAPGNVVAGPMSGSNVTFDLTTSSWHSTGTVNGNSMSGSASVLVNVNGMGYTLMGTWVAMKQ